MINNKNRLVAVKSIGETDSYAPSDAFRRFRRPKSALQTLSNDFHTPPKRLQTPASRLQTPVVRSPHTPL